MWSLCLWPQEAQNQPTLKTRALGLLQIGVFSTTANTRPAKTNIRNAIHRQDPNIQWCDCVSKNSENIACNEVDIPKFDDQCLGDFATLPASGCKPWQSDKNSHILPDSLKDKRRVGPDSSQPDQTFDWVIRIASLRGDPDKWTCHLSIHPSARSQAQLTHSMNYLSHNYILPPSEDAQYWEASKRLTAKRLQRLLFHCSYLNLNCSGTGPGHSQLHCGCPWAFVKDKFLLRVVGNWCHWYKRSPKKSLWPLCSVATGKRHQLYLACSQTKSIFKIYIPTMCLVNMFFWFYSLFINLY